MIFNAIKRAVQKAENEALLPLENRRRQVEQEITRLERDLKKNIDTLSNTISDMETVRNEEDPIFFLQVSNQSPVLCPSQNKLCDLTHDYVWYIPFVAWCILYGPEVWVNHKEIPQIFVHSHTQKADCQMS